jgi:hypothetical protein
VARSRLLFGGVSTVRCRLRSHAFSSASEKSFDTSTASVALIGGHNASKKKRVVLAKTPVTLSDKLINREQKFLDVLRKEVTTESPEQKKVRKWLTTNHTLQFFSTEVTFCYASIAGHLSFALLAASWTFQDMMSLRVLAVAAGLSSMMFTYWHPVGKTLWLPFNWNLLFVIINMVYLGDFLYRRYRAGQLTDEMLQLYNSVFYHTTLEIADYDRLLDLGKLRNFSPNTKLIQEGVPNGYVFLLSKGSCQVRVGDKPVYVIKHGQFIGEMALRVGLHVATPLPSNATVTTMEDTVAVVWERKKLIHHLDKNPHIAACLQAAVSLDLAQKALDPHAGQNKDYALVQAHSKQYRSLLITVMNASRDRKSWSHTKSTLHRFRLLHGISDEEHSAILKDVGWSKPDFANGSTPFQALLQTGFHTNKVGAPRAEYRADTGIVNAGKKVHRHVRFREQQPTNKAQQELEQVYEETRPPTND